MSEVTLDQLEKELEVASDRLGMALKNAPAAEKEFLSSMYDKLAEFVAEQKKKDGKTLDSSAMFAAGIIGSQEINDEELVAAAVNYIDKDLAYCRFRSAKK